MVRTKDSPEGDDNGHSKRGFKDKSHLNISFRSIIIYHSVVIQFLSEIMTKMTPARLNKQFLKPVEHFTLI